MFWKEDRRRIERIEERLKIMENLAKENDWHNFRVPEVHVPIDYPDGVRVYYNSCGYSGHAARVPVKKVVEDIIRYLGLRLEYKSGVNRPETAKLEKVEEK